MYYKRSIFAKSQLFVVKNGSSQRSLKEVDREYILKGQYLSWGSIKDSITTLQFSVNINVVFLHLLAYFATFLKNIVFRF